MKAIKIEIVVRDHENYGAKEISRILSSCRDIHATVISTQEKDIGEWYDEHPMNITATAVQAAHELFQPHGAKEACEAYINSLGGLESNAWHDAPVDGVFEAGFAAGSRTLLTEDDFNPSQWWVKELYDATNKGTPDQQRSYFVVLNLLRQIRQCNFPHPVSAAKTLLERIIRWHGEFPDGPLTRDGFEQSYGAAYGSNGERDYMRGLAVEALAALTDYKGTS